MTDSSFLTLQIVNPIHTLSFIPPVHPFVILEKKEELTDASTVYFIVVDLAVEKKIFYCCCYKETIATKVSVGRAVDCTMSFFSSAPVIIL